MSIFTFLLIGLLCACSSTALEIKGDQTIEKKFELKPENQQALLMLSDDWQSQQGVLYRFERLNDKWQIIGSQVSVVLGRSGLAWGKGLHPAQTGVVKKEGDGKAPAGVFTLGNAFGYLTKLNTELAYQQMSANDYCIDVNGSPYYNQIVTKLKVGEEGVKDSSEPMRRDIHLNGDHKYKRGLVVKHNPQNISAAGSCIFMHIWQAPNIATAGCTAMDEQKLTTLLSWLDPSKNPIYIALPKAEYFFKKSAWALPEVSIVNN
jgi:L,D-peptidoglycan transpeptidase YkuD (ErfK/YbiS/YcfS/YnhG family)